MPAGRSHVPVPAGRAGERRHRERAPGPDLSHPVRDKAVLGNRGQDGSPLHFAATDGFSLSGLSSMPRLTLRAATALPLVKLDVNPKKQGLPEPAPAILGSGVGHRRPNQRIAHRSRSRSADFRLPAPNSTALSGGRALLRPPGTSGMTGAPGRSIRPGRRSYPASWRARREIHRRSGGGSAARCAGRPVSQGRRTGWQPHPERPRENRCRIAAPYPFRRTGPSGTRRPPRLRGRVQKGGGLPAHPRRQAGHFARDGSFPGGPKGPCGDARIPGRRHISRPSAAAYPVFSGSTPGSLAIRRRTSGPHPLRAPQAPPFFRAFRYDRADDGALPAPTAMSVR